MVKDMYEDSHLAGKTGVVKSSLSGRVSVYLFDDGQEVDIPMTFLEPVPPVKNDKVGRHGNGSYDYPRTENFH
jgi:hypothetical protein